VANVGSLTSLFVGLLCQDKKASDERAHLDAMGLDVLVLSRVFHSTNWRDRIWRLGNRASISSLHTLTMNQLRCPQRSAYLILVRRKRLRGTNDTHRECLLDILGGTAARFGRLLNPPSFSMSVLYIHTQFSNITQALSRGGTVSA
jgi:hypothetical protein